MKYSRFSFTVSDIYILNPKHTHMPINPAGLTDIAFREKSVQSSANLLNCLAAWRSSIDFTHSY